MPREISNTAPGEIELLTNMKIGFSVNPALLNQVTLREVILGESLLKPGLQTSIRVHSYIHELPIKDLDQYKGSTVTLSLERPILERYGIYSKFLTNQQVYRIDNRKPINASTEEFTIHACDPSLLIDAATLVSKHWKCTNPSAVVSEVLTNCAGAIEKDIDPSAPARDYTAENIHPFQVVAQQAEVALFDGNDPSFLHYMTYNHISGNGRHHFRALRSLTKASSKITYYFDEAGAGKGYGYPFSAISYNFPCDFDLLSDILNGIGPDGSDVNSLVLFNPILKQFSIFGNKAEGCGVGGAVLQSAMTNFMSAQQQNACPDYTQFYALKRQARMGLLNQDKIALRISVPWNPNLHAGDIITLELYNKKAAELNLKNYGTGDYLILHLSHILQDGGYSVTTMDCVSQSVGSGIV